MRNVDPFVRLLVVGGVGYLVYLLTPILTPFLLSALLAYMGNPLVTRLARRGIPRAATVSVLFVLVALLLFALVIGVTPVVKRQTALLVERFPAYLDWFQNRLLDWSGRFMTFDTAEVKQMLLQQSQDVGKWLAQVMTFATGSGRAIFGVALNVLLVPVVTFYLMRDWEDIMGRAAHALPTRSRARYVAIGREVDAALGSFLRGQLSVMLVLAVFYTAGLSLVGVDLALAIGVLAGLVTFVPYLGFFVGIVTASLAAVSQFQDWLHVLLVWALFGVGQVLESMVLTPRLVGGALGLHPVVVIFAVMAGGALFGFFGILLALPASAVIMVWVRHLYAGDEATKA